MLVVAAYGLILPPAMLAWPRHGALNIHASLLPRWRGAAPIERALLAGDHASGVTIMQMDAGLDTGPIVDRVVVPIGARETAGTLHDRLAATGAGAIVDALRRIEATGGLASTPQPHDGVTYAGKIGRAEAAIDWRYPAHAIDRQVRALDPSPGAFAMHAGLTWKIWQAEPLASWPPAAPGTVVSAAGDAIVIACGEGVLAVRSLQAAGGRRLGARDVIAGRRLREGDVLAGGAAPQSPP